MIYTYLYVFVSLLKRIHMHLFRRINELPFHICCFQRSILPYVLFSLQWTCVYEFQEGAPPRPPVSPRCSLRLTHYIEEANVGRGYIKELCFSPDGRLICSPYGYGVRLLAFDERCAELADCMPVRTALLREVRSIYSHSDVVLTSKFSPTHCQLASGCLSGRVALYQPHF